MANSNNPIELLINLAVNSPQSKQNIDSNVLALKKYYEKNPLLINLDVNKSRALANVNKFIAEVSKKNIDIGVNVKGNMSTEIARMQGQAQGLTNEFEQLNRVMKQTGSSSTKSFNIDLDRVLIQLENLGRKGVVAQTQIDGFSNSIRGLKDTNDRLSLKEIVKDIFDISSKSGHADKVLQTLNRSLLEVGNAQQRLTGIKDKFDINPNTSDDYQRLASTIERLTQDMIRYQSVASSGGADQIKLAEQVRRVANEFEEARIEIAQFGQSLRTHTQFDQAISQAERLRQSLIRAGNLDNDSLDAYRLEIDAIGNSATTNAQKVNQLNAVMDRMRTAGSEASTDQGFENSLRRQINALEALEDKLIRIGNIHATTRRSTEYIDLERDVRALGLALEDVRTPRDLNNMREQFDETSRAIGRMGANATTASQQTRGLGASLETALQKFPIWMLSATLFYAPIRGMQDLVEKTVELDSALTQLKRVMDVPSYKMDNMIESMIENVDTLAGKTADYMKLTADFARTGLDDQESQNMANVATILQNISELNADEAVNSLTSAITSFGEETGGALRVADRLNEIDNNFAITTKDLALSMNKAASTAKTFGVELNDLLGYTTAIGVATRESGNIVGNSLKSIFARITTNDSAISALDAIGISINDVSGNVRSASDIIDEVAGRWDTLTDAQRQNTAVGVAGVYQLSRWNALMLNYEMGVDASTAAINSQNSAMNEQEIFAKSLEGRINQLTNSWYGFANSASEATLYDSIVVLTDIFQKAIGGGSSFVEAIGLLAPIAGIAGMAIFALSGNLRTLMVQEYQNAASASVLTGANKVLAGSMGVVAATAKGLTSMLRGLMIASGIGIVFAALGFALDKFIGSMSKSIQAQEEFDTYMRKNTDALGLNKDATEELISKYTELSKARENGEWNSDKEKEYLEVQTTLSETFPALIDYIDSTGQAHLKNTDAIGKEIEATKELMAQQDKLTVAEGADAFGNLLAPMGKVTQEADNMFGKLKNNFTDFFGSFKSMDTILTGTIQGQMNQLKAVIESMENSPTADPAKLEGFKLQLMQLEQQYAKASQEIKGHIMTVAKAQSEMEIDPGVTASVESFISSLNLSNLDEDGLQSFSVALSAIQDQIQEAIKTDNEGLYKEAIKNLNDLGKGSVDFDKKIQGMNMTYEEFINELGKGEVAFIDTEDAMNGAADGANNLTEAYRDFKDVSESMAGVTQKQIDDTADLLWQYEMLANQLGDYTDKQLQDLSAKTDLTMEEKNLISAYQDKEKIMSQLDAIYPSLLDKDGKAIKLSHDKVEAIKEEQRANEVLLKAYKLSRDGKLTAEQDMTLATASRTKKRIKDIISEITALIALQEQMYNTAMTNKEFLAGIDDGSVKSTGSGMAVPQPVFEAVNVTRKSVELQELRNLLNSSVDSVQQFSSAIEENSKSTGKNSSAKDKNNKATEKSIYLTDDYKNKLEKLNLEIQKEIALRDTVEKGSTKYTSSLETQLKLEGKKLDLMKAQEKSINAQIKSGKVQQTGMVKQAEAVETITKNMKLSGYGGRITSKFGERADNHRGTDIAGARGTGIDAFAGGKVVAAGYAGKKGAEKMHSSYGNVVVVQSDDGTKRLYAHMDKVLTKVGDQIEAGTRIGTIGTTGNSTGNHLHYEKTKNGKLVDSYDEVMQARKGVTTTTTKGGKANNVYAEQQQSIDQANSDLISLQGDILNQQQTINDLQKSIVESVVTGFEIRKSNYDKFLENSENRLRKFNKTSVEYRKELDAQATALKNKKKENSDEIKFLQDMIKKGGLTEVVIAELNDRLHDLGKINSDIDFAINDIEIQKAESYLELLNETTEKYEKQRALIDSIVDLEKTSMEELDVSSAKYAQSLAKINSELMKKQSINRQELTAIQKLIMNGTYYGESLEEAQQRVRELTQSIKELQLEIQSGNYDIFINIGTSYQEDIDNINSEISRADAIRKLYEEGSQVYVEQTKKMITEQEKLAQSHLKLRDAWMEELKNLDMTAEDRKKAIQAIKEQDLAYLNAIGTIKDYNKQLEDSAKSQKENIANKFISALKGYYQELKDEHLKSIDSMMNKETKAHEQRLKNLTDEMNKYRSNVEEKLKLLDRQEAERDYNMEITDLESERNKIQEEYNKLLLDPTTKSQRKKLQEQLDKIDKDIAEKRHDRDIELQKQGLNDMLETKEDEINGKIELEDKEFENTKNRIDKEKAYWEQHYNDLINDEREFARIRQEIMNGNMEKIVAEFSEHIDRMKETMPGLENTLDGTMQAVGTTIRQNVIDELQAAIDMVGTFQNAMSNMGSFNDKFNAPNFNEILGDGKNPSKSNLTEGDMKVLLGKFLTDNVANSLSGTQKTQAHSAGGVFGSAGRKEGSTIDKNTSFNSAIQGLTSSELEMLKAFFKNNASANGGAYSSYISDFTSGKTFGSSTGTMQGGRTPLKYGDMQLMMGKYVNETMLGQTKDTNLRKQLKSMGDSLASQGRAGGSQLNGTFSSLVGSFDRSQKDQLKTFMNNQSAMISDATLRNNLLRYVASLDKGGMTNFSGKGMDGKGGRFLLAHDNEIINNPLDSKRLLETVRESRAMAMDLAQSTMGLNNPTQMASQSFNNDGLTMVFHGNIGTIEREQANNFADVVFDKWKRQKGV